MCQEKFRGKTAKELIARLEKIYGVPAEKIIIRECALHKVFGGEAFTTGKAYDLGNPADVEAFELAVNEVMKRAPNAEIIELDGGATPEV